MGGIRGQGERHRETSFERARLECEVLDYLDRFGPVDVATIAAAFRLTQREARQIVEAFRQAEVVFVNPMLECALAPA